MLSDVGHAEALDALLPTNFIAKVVWHIVFAGAVLCVLR